VLHCRGLDTLEVPCNCHGVENTRLEACEANCPRRRDSYVRLFATEIDMKQSPRPLPIYGMSRQYILRRTECLDTRCLPIVEGKCDVPSGIMAKSPEALCISNLEKRRRKRNENFLYLVSIVDDETLPTALDIV